MEDNDKAWVKKGAKEVYRLNIFERNTIWQVAFIRENKQ